MKFYCTSHTQWVGKHSFLTFGTIEDDHAKLIELRCFPYEKYAELRAVKDFGHREKTVEEEKAEKMFDQICAIYEQMKDASKVDRKAYD